MALRRRENMPKIVSGKKSWKRGQKCGIFRPLRSRLERIKLITLLLEVTAGDFLCFPGFYQLFPIIEKMVVVPTFWFFSLPKNVQHNFLHWRNWRLKSSDRPTTYFSANSIHHKISDGELEVSVDENLFFSNSNLSAQVIFLGTRNKAKL